MTPHTLLFAATLLISSLVPVCAFESGIAPGENVPPSIKMAYTGNTMGFLEPCPS